MPQARQRFPFGLRFRLGLLVVLALAPAFALVGVTADALHRHDAEQAQATAAQAADFWAGHWRDTAAATQQTLLALGSAAQVRGDDMAACEALLQRLQTRMSAYDNIGVTDGQGMAICSAKPFEQPLDLSDQTWFQRAIAQRASVQPEVVIGEYQVSRITGHAVIHFALPLLAADGSVQRVLTIAVDLANLSGLPGLRLSHGATVTLVDDDLVVLGRYPAAEDWIGRDVHADPLMQQVLASGTSFLGQDLDGQRAYIAVRVAEVGAERTWALVALNYASVHARGQSLLRIALSVLSLVLVGAVLALAIIGEWGILRPTIALQRGAQRVAAGDLTARAPVRDSASEVGAVGQAFNDMAAALQQRLAERDAALEDLRHQRDLVGRLAEMSPAGITIVAADGQIVFANAEAERILGLARDEITQRSYNAPSWRIAAYDGRPFPDEQLPFALVQRTSQPVRGVRHAIAWPDGRRVFLQINGAPLFDEQGAFAGMVACVEDVTPWIQAQEESQRLNHALRLLSDCNQALVHSETEQELLNAICHTLVLHGDYQLAWVGYPQEDAQRNILAVASSGSERDWLDRSGISWADVPRGRGPTGVAIRTRRPALARYVAGDPQFEVWRHEIEERGLLAALSLPLLEGNDLFGALTLYSDDSAAFDAQEASLLGELADDLAYGIRALRARAAQRAAEAEIAQLARFPGENPNPVLRLGLDGGVLYANPAAERALTELGLGPRGPLPQEWLAPVHQAVATGRASSCELMAGARTWSVTVASAAQYADVNVYARDISPLVRAQQAVERHDEAQAIVNRLLVASLAPATLAQLAQQALDQVIALPWLQLLPKGYVYLRGPDDQGYRLEASLGIGEESLEACVNCGAETCDCLLQREVQYIPHAGHPASERLMTESHVHYCLPILSGKEAVGALSLHLPPGQRLDAQSESALRAVANALAIIRAHKLSEGALAQEQALAHALQDSVPDYIYFKDAELRYLRINRALAGLYGLSDPAQAAGKTDDELGAPLSLHGAPDEERQVLATGETLANHEEHLVWPDGHESWLSVTRAPLRDAAGQVVGMYAIARDISERRLLEQRIFQSQKLDAIGRLASGVAHDFNGILTVINGYTDLILSSLETDDPLRSDLEQVAQAGKRGEALARQLLALGRRGALQPHPLNLSEVVRGVQPMLARIVREEIRLDVHLGNDLGAVYADPGQIEQVLVNLVSNARDAIAQAGSITIETANVEMDTFANELHGDTCSGPHVMVAVSDTGAGFSPEILEHLFEPFYTTKEPGRGTGLGLSVVYGIARQSGGCVQVASQPGVGTRVAVYLPRLAQPAQDAAARARPAIPHGNETILVVEDQPQVRAVIARMLQGLGYQVLQAGSGPDALALVEREQERIALVLTDVVMPEMRGTQLARVLHERAPACRIVFMSGYTDLGAAEHEAFDQAGGVLHKPFAADALALKLRQALDGA